MLFRIAVAGVLSVSGAVSREIDEDSFVEEAEEEEVEEEEVEDADDDAALDGDEVEEEEEDDESVDDEDADGEEDEDEEEENEDETEEEKDEVAPDPKYKGKSHSCNTAGKKIALGKTDGSQWRCKEGYCIPLKGRCNGYANCHDSTDEKNCPDKSDHNMALKCDKAGMKIEMGHDDGKQFRCHSSYCIPLKAKCNGFKNCYDGTDETNC